jgi:hypothetical protein
MRRNVIAGWSPAGVLAAAFFCLAAGCTATPENAVTGKVTLDDGRPVTDGFVTFFAGDSRKATAHIMPDGRYQVVNPPKGPVRVAVSAPPVFPMPPGAPPLAGAPNSTALPRRYEDPNNGLTATVTGGRQTVDLELKP